MEMYELYAQLEAKLKEIEPAYLEAENDYEFHMAEAEKASNKMDSVKASVEALRKAIAALAEGDFSAISKPEESKEPVTKIVYPSVLPTVGVMPVSTKSVARERAGKKRYLEVWQYKPNGDVINNWTSQRMAAKALGWSQSGLSHFMKYSKEKQIRERGYYIEWVG